MAQFDNLGILLKSLHSELNATAAGTDNVSYTITPTSGLYALINDIASSLVTLKNTIRMNERGVIAQLAADGGADVNVALATGTANSSTAAYPATLDVSDSSMVTLGTDAATQSLSANLTTTSRGRSLTLADNPAMLWGTEVATGYTESALFCLLAEQRQMLKKLLAGTLTASSGQTVADRGVVALDV